MVVFSIAGTDLALAQTCDGICMPVDGWHSFSIFSVDRTQYTTSNGRRALARDMLADLFQRFYSALLVTVDLFSLWLSVGKLVYL